MSVGMGHATSCHLLAIFLSPSCRLLVIISSSTCHRPLVILFSQSSRHRLVTLSASSSRCLHRLREEAGEVGEPVQLAVRLAIDARVEGEACSILSIRLSLSMVLVSVSVLEAGARVEGGACIEQVISLLMVVVAVLPLQVLPLIRLPRGYEYSY